MPVHPFSRARGYANRFFTPKWFHSLHLKFTCRRMKKIYSRWQVTWTVLEWCFCRRKERSASSRGESHHPVHHVQQKQRLAYVWMAQTFGEEITTPRTGGDSNACRSSWQEGDSCGPTTSKELELIGFTFWLLAQAWPKAKGTMMVLGRLLRCFEYLWI